jgi:nucleolar protein 4
MLMQSPPFLSLPCCLQARFDRFGPVKACRVVMDKATGKPKGTAFIEFRAPAGAAAAAEACARARAGKGPDVTVKGAKLNVDLALTQDDARRLGQEQGGVPGAGQTAGQSNKGGKFDRRNLYLAKEGFIEEGSAQWEAMSENDRWAWRIMRLLVGCRCTAVHLHVAVAQYGR